MKENAEKFRALDPAELDKQLREGAEQMFRLRFQMSMGQMEGLKKLRSMRKERARMLTVIRERELGHEVAPKKEAAPRVAAAKKVKRSPKGGSDAGPFDSPACLAQQITVRGRPAPTVRE